MVAISKFHPTDSLIQNGAENKCIAEYAYLNESMIPSSFCMWKNNLHQHPMVQETESTISKFLD